MSLPRPAECARRDVYFCVIGGKVEPVLDADREDDLRRYACGNYFHSAEAAEAALKQLGPAGLAETTYD